MGIVYHNDIQPSTNRPPPDSHGEVEGAALKGGVKGVPDGEFLRCALAYDVTPR